MVREMKRGVVDLRGLSFNPNSSSEEGKMVRKFLAFGKGGKTLFEIFFDFRSIIKKLNECEGKACNQNRLG